MDIFELSPDEAHKQFQEIAEISSDWVWEVDQDGRYTYVSDRIKTFLGYTPEEMLGKSPFELMSSSEAKRVGDIFLSYASKHLPFKDLENVNLHKNGQEITLSTSGIPVFNPDGSFKGYRGTDKDISKEKELLTLLETHRYNLDQAQRIANIGHWELDILQNSLYWSDQVYRIFGLKPREIGATYDSFLTFIHPDDREMVNNAYASSVQNKSKYQIVHRVVSADGKLKFVEERCEHQIDHDGNVVKSIGTVQDITAKVQNEKALKLASSVFTYSNDAIVITNKKNEIITVNQACEKLTGFTPAEVIGKNPRILGSGWGNKKFYEQMWNEILTKGIWEGQICDKKKNGEIYTASQAIIAIKNRAGEVENFIGISSDITQLVKEQEEKQKALTTSRFGDLKNRYALFEDIKNYHLSNAALIDLNRFHQINDFYGYAISDELLNEVSLILKTKCHGTYEVYHFNADTFVITMPDTIEPDIFAKVIEDILDSLENNIFVVDEYEISVSATGVIANGSSDVLLRLLDMALKYAKEKRLRFWIHDAASDFTAKFRQNLHWTKELKSAFKEDRLTVYFQPIYSLESHEIERYESLVRLIGTEGEVVTPNFFLDAAEQSNQMFRLTETVFIKTLEMLKQCKGKYKFSINISTMDMQNPHFLALVQEHLGDFSLAHKICFEILETYDITDLNAVANFVELVHRLGCQVAIDDFGSGYANFENLIKLDIDIIKIDGTLIEKIATHQDAYDIVDAIVGFAQKRKMKTIAEFVRNRSIFNIAEKIGIDYVQGYYIAKPSQHLDTTVESTAIDSNEPYKLMIYVSQAKTAITYENASAILNASWRKNRQNGIGGILLYDKTFFIQLLNGPVDKVDRIFERISQDDRHHSIRLMGEYLSQTQEFHEWNMGFLPKSDMITAIFESHNVQEGSGLYNAEFADLEKLLKELTLYV